MWATEESDDPTRKGQNGDDRHLTAEPAREPRQRVVRRGREQEDSATKRGGGDPATRGRTTIADGVVEKIAGLAARDVLGVHAMGSGISRTFGAVRDRVPGGSKSVDPRV